jgi:predicted MFS family arabinose efflux permease
MGGFLVDADLFGLGWRTIFWVNVPIAAVALVLGSRVLPESTSQHRAALDVVGAVLLTLGVILMLLPLVQGRDWGWPWWGFALMAAGVLLLSGFLAYERSVARRGGQPVLDPALLRVRSFGAGLMASMFFFGAIGAFFLTLSIYLQAGTGRTAWQTGLVILPYAIGSIVTSGLGVAMAAKAGRALLVSGSLGLAASQALLWFIVRDGQNPEYWMLALALFIGGLGLGLAAPILVNVVLAGIPGKDAGAAGGVLSTVNQIGGAAGVAALGTLFFTALDSHAADVAQLPGFSDAFAAVLPVEIALYLLAAALMLLLPRATAAHNA